jgi:hypothetical protein
LKYIYPHPESFVDRHTVKYASIAFLFIAVSVAFLRRIYDFDVWFHLSIGREVLTKLRIPATEIFVYPLIGAPGAYHEWGFGALLYFLYSHFGFWGISFLNGVIAGLSVVLLYLTASRDKSFSVPAIFFLSLLLPVIEYRFVYRPETVLYLSMAAEVFLLERYSLNPAWKWLAPVPILCLILSYFHPSAIMLMIIFLSYVTGWVSDEVRSGTFERKRTGIFIGVLFTSILASALNPYGIRQLILPFIFSGEKAYLQTNPEFRPILETAYKFRFILSAVIGLLPILFVRGGRRITYGSLYVIFGFLAFKYQRNLAMFALVMYVPVVYSINRLTGMSAWFSRTVPRIIFSALALLLLIAAILSAGMQGRWGAGPVNSFFPEKSARFMLEFRPAGKIFNYYHTGNYLEWMLYPAYQVSIDGRHYTYDRSLDLYMRVFSLEQGWEKILQDNQVGVIITPGTHLVSGTPVSLVSALDADPDWSLAVTEPGAMLFIKTDMLTGIHGAQALDKDLIWEHVMKEAANNLYYYPDESGAYLSFGIACFKLHRFREAAEQFNKYLIRYPGNSEIQQIVSLMDSAARGDLSAGQTLDSIYRRGRFKSK